MVGRDTEGECVGLGEHVVTVELLENPFGGVLRHAQFSGALPELFPVECDEFLVVSADEGPAKLVGLDGAEPGHVHGHLVHLVLKENDPQGPFQGALLQGVVIVPGGALAAPLYEQAYTVVDPHAGAYRADFVGHVGQVHRLNAWRGLHLGSRFHLEHPDGVGLVNHPVDGLVVEIYAAQVYVVSFPLLDKL